MQFDKLNKLAKKSFNQQKIFIKKVLNGKQTTCETCQQELQIILPSKKNNIEGVKIFCKQGCTDLKLDVDIS